MFWLEMSRDQTHGGENWGFTKNLWAPTRKQHAAGTEGSKWGFWETLTQVRPGDSVLHLRGVGDEAAFVGYSTAETRVIETSQRPPSPGQWGYSSRFYRVWLRDYVPLPNAISLRGSFTDRESALRDYFYDNKAKAPGMKKRIFYVVQRSRIQCLNGAYLSELDDELAGILLGPDYQEPLSLVSGASRLDTATAQRIRELKTRVGQQDFSASVRQNYGHRCCFPECRVSENAFLVGAHIARWADVPELRGLPRRPLAICRRKPSTCSRLMSRGSCTPLWAR